MHVTIAVAIHLAAAGVADVLGPEPSSRKCGSLLRWVGAFLVGGVCSRACDVWKARRVKPPPPAPKRRVRLEIEAAGDCADDCSICLEQLASFGQLGRLRCGHAFHRNCIERWLDRGAMSCPVCRTDAGCDRPKVA